MSDTDDDDLAASVRAYGTYVTAYLRAARLLPDTDKWLLYPRCQLLGQALELALKAFLVSRGTKPPRGRNGHQLNDLLATARSLGLSSDDNDTFIVERLHDVYAELTSESWKYPARYPPPKDAGLWVWVMTGTTRTAALVESIYVQASTKR